LARISFEPLDLAPDWRNQDGSIAAEMAQLASIRGFGREAAGQNGAKSPGWTTEPAK